jgi:deoxyribonucleoside regulator
MSDDYERIGTLVNIARMYFEYGYSQSMIADALGLSRPYVSKLISEARERGIVSITINDPQQSESRLERELRARFELRRVIVVPSSEDGTALVSIGQAAARYLNGIIKSGDIIGMGWGTTMFSLARHVIKRDDLEDVKVVAFSGLRVNLEQNVYGVEIITRTAGALGAVPYIMAAPTAFDTAPARRDFETQSRIERVLALARGANIAIFTLGDFKRTTSLTREGVISEQQTQLLMASGAVGDVCLHVIDQSGRLCDEALDARIMALPLENIRQKEYRIGIAAGRNKIEPVYAALCGGIVNVLVVDEDIAKAVMARDD